MRNPVQLIHTLKVKKEKGTQGVRTALKKRTYRLEILRINLFYEPTQGASPHATGSEVFPRRPPVKSSSKNITRSL